MSSRRTSFWPLLSLLCGAIVVVIALPSSLKNSWAPGWLNPSFHLGLDLAGGTQLDFRISESEMEKQLASVEAKIGALEQSGSSSTELTQLRNEKYIIEQQQQNIVEAIRVVLERRINALGVSEAVITPSYVGNEKHLLVECPGVVDVQECIATVGKTIQLEFKEEFTEATAEFESDVRARAREALRKITESGVTLTVLGQDIGSTLGMGYQDSALFFHDQLPKGLETLWNAKPSKQVLLREGSLPVQTQNADGKPVTEDIPGVFLVEVLAPRTMTGRIIVEAETAFAELAKTASGAVQKKETGIALDQTFSPNLASALRGMQPGDLSVATMEDGSAKLLFLQSFTAGHEEVDVSHILVTYSGANAAEASVRRTKEEALARAKLLQDKLAKGANFEELARKESDGPSAKNAGKLGPIARGQLVPAFEQVAFSQAAGIISDPVETPFGYHLIRVNSAPTFTPDRATFSSLTLSGDNAENRAETLLARLRAGEVRRQEEAITLRSLFFSLKPTGWKDTTLDGKHFRAAAVQLDPTTNLPVVQIIFDEEGGKIFHELTKRNVGKRIAIFVGGELVSAPTVQTEISGGTAIITGSGNVEEAQKLAQDLNTGAIPAPVYLSGQHTIEATLGAEALSTSVFAGIIGMIIIMLYMILVYRFLGAIASVALLIYAAIFLAILKLPLLLVTDQYVVLTLAGAAGTILSIGMAVDTNVLVFERVKEELRRGKMLRTAVEIGFEKAWPSIRDSNLSTLITCGLLFMIGTSIVRGFAITLGLGVIISMFTGMIITRWIARKLADTSIAEKYWLFPGAKSVR